MASLMPGWSFCNNISAQSFTNMFSKLQHGLQSAAKMHLLIRFEWQPQGNHGVCCAFPRIWNLRRQNHFFLRHFHCPCWVAGNPSAAFFVTAKPSSSTLAAQCPNLALHSFEHHNRSGFVSTPSPDEARSSSGMWHATVALEYFPKGLACHSFVSKGGAKAAGAHQLKDLAAVFFAVMWVNREAGAHNG